MAHHTSKTLYFTIAALMIAYHFIYRYIHEKYFKKKDDAENIPENCPGEDSTMAGKASQCEGCPNQTKCASGEAQVEAQALQESVVKNLRDVNSVILVMSGKGGVGKSSIATQLSFALESSGYVVGLLDIDITGPSIPGMTATQGAEVFESSCGWSPVYVSNSLAVLSVGHLLKDPKSSIIWRGPKKDSLIKQFLVGVNWEKLDYLIVDCPPGSSDEHISICNFLKNKMPKAIIVTTPQLRAIDDVYRSCEFCKIANINIMALVVNMTGSVFECGNDDSIKQLCNKFEIDNLVKVPLDKEITKAGESGKRAQGINSIEELMHVILHH